MSEARADHERLGPAIQLARLPGIPPFVRLGETNADSASNAGSERPGRARRTATRPVEIARLRAGRSSPVDQETMPGCVTNDEAARTLSLRGITQIREYCAVGL